MKKVVGKEKVITKSIEDVSLYLLNLDNELKITNPEDDKYKDGYFTKDIQLVSKCGKYIAKTYKENGVVLGVGFYKCKIVQGKAYTLEHVEKPSDISDVEWEIEENKEVDLVNGKLPSGDILVRTNFGDVDNGYETLEVTSLKDFILEIQQLANTIASMEPKEFKAIYTGLSTGEIQEPKVIFDNFVEAIQYVLKGSIDSFKEEVEDELEGIEVDDELLEEKEECPDCGCYKHWSNELCEECMGEYGFNDKDIPNPYEF